MKKKPTPESELNELHAIVAKTLRDQLEATMIVADEEGKEKEISLATPALLAQAIKFLKDNNITTVEEMDENMDQLKELLEKKQKRGSKVLHMSAARAAKED